MSYFPMYVELKARPCLIAGGGKIAARKVEVLLDFEAEVTVVAPVFAACIEENKRIHKIAREFCEEDLDGIELVVAATDDTSVNHEIANLCKKKGIPVNAVDQKEDCTFIFPSYVKKGEVTAAVTSGGLSPVITQYIKAQIEALMPAYIGELAQELGGIRPVVKEALPTEKQRRTVYAKLLELALDGDGTFSKEDAAREIQRISME